MNSRIKTIFFFVAGCVLAYLYVATAKADEAVLNWTAPTGSESCSADPSDPDPEFYRIYQLIGEVAHPTTTFSTGPLLPGDYAFLATTVQRNTGVESRVSGAATKTVGPLIVTAGATAYQAVTISTGFWMIPMATVDADTECDGSVSVNRKYYRIPDGSYTWNPGTTAEPVMLVAECG